MSDHDEAGTKAVKAKWEEWRRVLGQLQHADRFPLMRMVQVEVNAPGQDHIPTQYRDGTALTLNYSWSGLCVLMSWKPEVNQVLQIHVPHSIPVGIVPTQGDVRWMRTLPFGDEERTHVVGIKFIR